MKFQSIVQVGVLAASMALSSVSAFAENTQKVSDAETKKIQTIVHDYLINNPEVLLEAGRELQKRQREQLMSQAHKAIIDNSAQLFSTTSSPVSGNAKGNVNLVEFFDYQCIHCKHMTKTVGELLKTDKNIRVIYKEFPIFGKSSEYAAKVALAANRQGKFTAFHEALMNVADKLDEAKVQSVAKKVGLNWSKVEKDMQDPAISKELSDNQKLAEQMGIMATPVFVLGSNPVGANMKTQFIPGAVELPMLEGLVKLVR